ncbi:acetyl-CoA hydrolase/transferase family protein [Lampropedia puyangensis]|uniref:Acetyl-CoA hydrolase/transferase family protein n=1 Tax=Lampropedia puyangensis TaxID=1330072 RepID=A0A4S8EZ63_9BURK|nr:acetyl-CoA hydrolase/transferase C-terminal domain-containing protein [Lampropedia puyangensis]THU00230.1 acetyl-CoA hydrolase/transferase family protein [Lampropedia puyangensis]
MGQQSVLAQYDAKKSTAEEAVALIPSGARIALGLAIAEPPAILKALAARAQVGEVGDLRMHYLLAGATAGQTVFQLELADRITPVSLFHGSVERALDKQRASLGLPPVAFIPTSFGRAPFVMNEVVQVDTLLTTVSPMDDEGYFTCGTNVDYAQPVAQKAQRVIVEVNPHMPHVYGNSRVHISQVTALVENAVALAELPDGDIGKEDAAIGDIVAGFIHDGDCLQMGIGALPSAICSALKHHRYLGVHTEMMVAGLADLMRSGAVDNSRKQLDVGVSVYAFAMGPKSLYEFMHRNPMVQGHPVDYVNNPTVIARNDNVVSVNATLEVDLFGACNSEYIQGRQYSASGGQLDFVRGANYSKNGRSIIACHSTAAKGKASRIVPQLSGPVTTPRNDVHIIVTEHGYADLRGKTVSERAQALIAIAHPAFREELAQQAKLLRLF